MMPKNESEYSPEEAARRRDEVIRRMANTPPQHRVSPSSTQRKAKPIASRRAARQKKAKA